MIALGIDKLGVFGMPPLAYAALVRALGCDHIGLGLAPSGTYNPQGYPDWSLRDDPALRRATRDAIADHGLRIGIVEGFAVGPGRSLAAMEPDLDICAELGATRIAAVSLDKDLARSAAGLAGLVDAAAARGLAVSAELGSLGPIPSVAAALDLIAATDRAGFSLMLDAMHVFRLGNTLADMATIPPTRIGYAQLCDAPASNLYATYIEEALYERRVPGEGALPLEGFVRALPDGIVMAIEIPRRSLADAGIGPFDRLAPCVAAARQLLALRENAATAR